MHASLTDFWTSVPKREPGVPSRSRSSKAEEASPCNNHATRLLLEEAYAHVLRKHVLGICLQLLACSCIVCTHV